jgi:hypothetical protein
MRHKTLVFLILLSLSGYGYYYYFVQTLTLSDIMGRTNVTIVDIFVNLLDFDTGLTRYDLHNLSKKSGYSNMRIREVESIQDPRRRQAEQEKLVAEHLEDPALKKIVRKTLGFGTKSALGILQAILQ